ncbi:MAG: hypothetical protein O7C63_04565 [Alphaproteobacteria bacterium]|nr:hypothetical protein [Alphaproteobacteria bacterium]
MVKSALLGIGFGFVHDCRTVGRVRDAAVADTKPDIFVLDLDGDKDAVCALIEDVRYSRLGDNPFVIMIGMTRRPEEIVIHHVLDAGTDDIIAKPISAKILSERIAYLSLNRKDFVAAPGYLGPQRAKGVRPDMEKAARVKVPNSLGVKASGKAPTKIDEIEIKRAANSFTLQRLYGIILPIINLSSDLENSATEHPDGEKFEGEISRIVNLVGEIGSIEMPETVLDLNHLTNSLEKVVDSLAAAPSPSSRQFEIVRLHAQAIAATMRGDNRDSGDVVSAFDDIDEAP